MVRQKSEGRGQKGGGKRAALPHPGDDKGLDPSPRLLRFGCGEGRFTPRRMRAPEPTLSRRRERVARPRSARVQVWFSGRTHSMRSIPFAALAALLLLSGCGGHEPRAIASSAQRPNIILITLDTTRVDAIGPEAVGIETPSFNAVAKRGLRFRQAYCAVPQTLPSHTS